MSERRGEGAPDAIGASCFSLGEGRCDIARVSAASLAMAYRHCCGASSAANGGDAVAALLVAERVEVRLAVVVEDAQLVGPTCVVTRPDTNVASPGQ